MDPGGATDSQLTDSTRWWVDSLGIASPDSITLAPLPHGDPPSFLAILVGCALYVVLMLGIAAIGHTIKRREARRTTDRAMRAWERWHVEAFTPEEREAFYRRQFWERGR